MMHRRQKWQVAFAALLSIIVVVNILFYFILLRPAQSDFANLQGNIDQLSKQVDASKVTKARLERTSDQLERFDQDRESMFAMHFIKFDPGFAELSPRLSQMAMQAGVLRPVVDFGREEIKQYGLYSVKIKIPVTGTYANAVNFIKMLETSDTFFLIDSMEVRSSGEASNGSNATAPPGTVAVAAPRPAAGPVAPAQAPAPKPAVAGVELSLTLETFFYK